MRQSPDYKRRSSFKKRSSLKKSKYVSLIILFVAIFASILCFIPMLNASSALYDRADTYAFSFFAELWNAMALSSFASIPVGINLIVEHFLRPHHSVPADKNNMCIEVLLIISVVIPAVALACYSENMDKLALYLCMKESQNVIITGSLFIALLRCDFHPKPKRRLKVIMAALSLFAQGYQGLLINSAASVADISANICFQIVSLLTLAAYMYFVSGFYYVLMRHKLLKSRDIYELLLLIMLLILKCLALSLTGFGMHDKSLLLTYGLALVLLIMPIAARLQAYYQTVSGKDTASTNVSDELVTELKAVLELVGGADDQVLAAALNQMEEFKFEHAHRSASTSELPIRHLPHPYPGQQMEGPNSGTVVVSSFRHIIKADGSSPNGEAKAGGMTDFNAPLFGSAATYIQTSNTTTTTITKTSAVYKFYNRQSGGRAGFQLVRSRSRTHEASEGGTADDVSDGVGGPVVSPEIGNESGLGAGWPFRPHSNSDGIIFDASYRDKGHSKLFLLALNSDTDNSKLDRDNSSGCQQPSLPLKIHDLSIHDTGASFKSTLSLPLVSRLQAYYTVPVSDKSRKSSFFLDDISELGVSDRSAMMRSDKSHQHMDGLAFSDKSSWKKKPSLSGRQLVSSSNSSIGIGAVLASGPSNNPHVIYEEQESSYFGRNKQGYDDTGGFGIVKDDIDARAYSSGKALIQPAPSLDYDDYDEYDNEMMTIHSTSPSQQLLVGLGGEIETIREAKQQPNHTMDHRPEPPCPPDNHGYDEDENNDQHTDQPRELGLVLNVSPQKAAVIPHRPIAKITAAPKGAGTNTLREGLSSNSLYTLDAEVAFPLQSLGASNVVPSSKHPTSTAAQQQQKAKQKSQPRIAVGESAYSRLLTRSATFSFRSIAFPGRQAVEDLLLIAVDIGSHRLTCKYLLEQVRVDLESSLDTYTFLLSVLDDRSLKATDASDMHELMDVVTALLRKVSKTISACSVYFSTISPHRKNPASSQLGHSEHSGQSNGSMMSVDRSEAQ